MSKVIAICLVFPDSDFVGKYAVDLVRVTADGPLMLHRLYSGDDHDAAMNLAVAADPEGQCRVTHLRWQPGTGFVPDSDIQDRLQDLGEPVDPEDGGDGEVPAYLQ